MGFSKCMLVVNINKNMIVFDIGEVVLDDLIMLLALPIRS